MDIPRPVLEAMNGVVKASESRLGERFLYCDGNPALLFTENDTNTERLLGQPNRTPYVKDAINNYIVHGIRDAVNPKQSGTKAAAQYHVRVPSSSSETIKLRFTPAEGEFGEKFDKTMQARRTDADDF